MTEQAYPTALDPDISDVTVSCHCGSGPMHPVFGQVSFRHDALIRPVAATARNATKVIIELLSAIRPSYG